MFLNAYKLLTIYSISIVFAYSCQLWWSYFFSFFLLQVYIWYPINIVTGGTTAKIMLAAKNNFLGKYIYKDTLDRNLAAVIYRVRSHFRLMPESFLFKIYLFEQNMTFSWLYQNYMYLWNLCVLAKCRALDEHFFFWLFCCQIKVTEDQEPIWLSLFLRWF